MTTRRTSRRNWGWKGLALVLVLITAAYFSRGFFQRFHKTYPPNSFYQVKRADMLISIVEEGALRALNETVIRSTLEGFNRIIHLAPEGSYVEKGDLLVELDSSGLKDRLNEQELQYQERLFQMLQAKGNLNIQKSLVESEIKDAELRLENAQIDFEKYRDGDAPLLIKTIEARSNVLGEQVRIARERHARTEELFKAGNATRSEVEADALSLKREQLALDQYQEDFRLIQKYDKPNQLRLLKSNVEQAAAELERSKQRTSNEIAQAEADLKTSQSALDYMDEGLDMLRERLKSTKIMAPQNGLVVYAQVSPFQSFGGDDRRRDEGRFRMGGRGGGQPGGGGNGEFRGGGRRGGRGNSENTSRASSSSSSSTPSSTAETVASGNQRIASAVSGSPVTDSSGAGGGNASSGGGRSGGSSAGGSGSSGGQNASSAVGAFASYPSMRQSSLFGGSSAAGSSSATGAGAGTGAGTSGSGSSGTGSANSSTTDNQRSGFNVANQLANQFGLRSGSRNFDFGDMSFTPGMLEEGLMVRQRQELIRLPDVSKMLAEIKVEETRVAQVKPGMTAYIQVRNIPNRQFKGTVRRVALLPDAQSSWMNPDKKVFPTDIMVEEQLPILKPGVSANVEVIITNLTKVLSVPIQTVARLNGENVCFIKKGIRVAPVPVTTGWFNDEFVEITSGLKEGDMVLLAPVSDEEEEEPDETESAATNQAQSATAPRTQQPVEEVPADGRRFQRRNSESTDGETPPERPRNRQGGGRRSNSQNAPE